MPKQPNATEKDVYVTRRSRTPPILTQRDGVWIVVVMDGDLTIEAPLGHRFIQQLFERVILPKVNK